MVWWLVKDCFSAMIRPLRLTTYSGKCVPVKFCTIVSYLLIFTNHHRFKHGVVVNGRVLSAMIRLTTPSVKCVAVKFSIILSYLLTIAGSSMMWWLMKECFSAMIRPLRLTTPSVEWCSCEIQR